METLKTTETNLDKKFNTLFSKLVNLEMYQAAKELNDLYYSTKINAYKRANQNALNIFNKQ